MEFQSATSRKLDEEHRDNLALLSRLQGSVLGVAPGARPDEAFAALARLVARHITDEIDRHFRFEEDVLFPRLAAAGEGDIADLLVDEHKAIRATAADLLPMLLAASTAQADPAGFAALKPVALEFVERLEAHIHKETHGLLPMIDHLLDERADHELVFAYAAP